MYCFLCLKKNRGNPLAGPVGGQVRMSGGGHRLLHLLPRLLFFIDPDIPNKRRAKVPIHQCSLVLEGRWIELFGEARRANAKERPHQDSEQTVDISDIVTCLVERGFLAKALKKATDWELLKLSPDIVRKLRVLCSEEPQRYDQALEDEMNAYAAANLPNPADLDGLFNYLPDDNQTNEEYIREF